MLRYVLCCCSSASSDDGDTGDYQRLINDHASPVRASDNDTIADSWNSVNGNRSGSIDGRSGGVAHSLEDEETALLNRILDQTQQSIIDVSNMDGTVIGGNDYITRSAKYDELLKRYKPVGQQTTDSKQTVLLDDAGNHLNDYLGRPPLSNTILGECRQLAADMNQAIRDGVRVEHKEDLVVFMTLHD